MLQIHNLKYGVSLVTMLVAGKRTVLYVTNIFSKCPLHLLSELGILLYEFGSELIVHAEQIVDYEYLAIAIWPGSNTDGGYR